MPTLIALESEDSKSCTPSEQMGELGETLYLVTRLLTGRPELQGTLSMLQQELQRHQLLGYVRNWRGVSRVATLDDVSLQHSRLAHDQLLLHLRRSVSMIEDDAISSATPAAPQAVRLKHKSVSPRSLLAPLPPSGGSNVAMVQSEAAMVDLVASLRRRRSLMDELLKTQSQLQSLQLQQDACEDDSKQETSADEQKWDDLGTEMEGSFCPLLTRLGRDKFMARLIMHEESLRADLVVQQSEHQNALQALRALGALRSPFYKGTVKQNTALWLQARSLGLASIGFSSTVGGGGLLQTLSSSTEALRNARKSNFCLLWTVTGHWYSAYCCLFDRTGKFFITGADDKIVKIWDVERGLLVRTLRGHEREITDIAVSPDNSLVASGCAAGHVLVWGLQDGRCLLRLRHRPAQACGVLGVNVVDENNITGSVAGAGVDNQIILIRFDARGALTSVGSDGQCIIWDLSRLLPQDRLGNLLQISRATKGQLSIFDSSAQCKLHKLKVKQELEITRDTDSILPKSSEDLEKNDTEIHKNQKEEETEETSVGDAKASGAENPETIGMFSWSKYATHPARLVLKHVPDMSEIAETGGFAMHGLGEGSSGLATEAEGGSGLRVTCLDVSPLGCLVVTGCEDGVARVWKYHDVPNMALSVASSTQGVAEYTTRRSTAHLETSHHDALKNLRGLLSLSELDALELVLQHLLLRLQGHSGGITDVHFSNTGDRVATASQHDGTARVWSLSKDLSRSEQIVLALAETEGISVGLGTDGFIPDTFPINIGSGGRLSAGGRRLTRSREKIQAYNVCWTADDSRIITLQNISSGSASGGSRLKVWDSFTGDLLRMIYSIGTMPCKQLRPHPLDSRLALTGGDDGRVCMWNVETEMCVFSHDLNLSETALEAAVATGMASGPCEVYDLDFSQDGLYAVACDSLGRVSVFGLDSPNKHTAAAEYPQQFFSSDYSEFTIPTDGIAVDVGTEQLVHASPLGALCKHDLTAYPTQIHPPPGPPALSAEEVQQDLAAKTGAEASAACSKAISIAFAVFSRNKKTCRQPKIYKSAKVQREEEQAVASARRITGNSHTGPRASANPRRATSTTIYRSDALLSDDHSSSSDGDEDYDHREGLDLNENDTLTALWTRGGTATRRRAPARTSGRIVLDSDDSENEPDARRSQSQDASKRRKGRPRATGRTGSSGLSRKKRTGGKRKGRSRSFESGSVSTESSCETSSEESAIEELYDSDEAPQAEKKKTQRRKRTQDSLAQDNEGEKENTRIGSRGARQSRSTPHWSREAVPLGVQVSRQWLQAQCATNHQYVPQVGDRVIYFPQGHVEALQLFAEDTAPPWLAFPAKWPLVLCLVTDVRFSFPTQAEHLRCTSVLAIANLEVIAIPHKNRINVVGGYHCEFLQQRQSRHSSAVTGTAGRVLSFSVTLRDCGTPDFLVLESRFMRSISLPWHEGIRVTCAYHDLDQHGQLTVKEFAGRVHSMKNRDSQWPQSPWEALQVEWDDSSANQQAVVSSSTSVDPDRLGNRTSIALQPLHRDVDCISPWEAEQRGALPSSSSSSSSHDSSVTIRLSVETCAQLDAAIALFIKKDKKIGRYAPFADDVDADLFPDYYCIVPVPFTISLLRARLQQGYYRQLSAIEADIRRIHSNCLRYNAEGAPINEAARDLSEALVSILYQDVSHLNQDGKTDNVDSEAEQAEVDPEDIMEEFGAEEEKISSQSSGRTVRKRTCDQNQQLNRKNKKRKKSPALKHSAWTQRPTRSSIRYTNTDTENAKVPHDEDEHDGISNNEVDDRYEEDDSDDDEEDSNEDSSNNSEEEEEEKRRSSKRSRRSETSSNHRSAGNRKQLIREVSSVSSHQGYSLAASERPARQARIRLTGPRTVPESSEDDEEDQLPALRLHHRQAKKKGISKIEAAELGRGQRDLEVDADLQAGLLQQFDRKVNEEAVLLSRGPQRVDINTKKELVSLLNAAKNADAQYGMFAYPVSDDVAPCYSSIITHPMDLSTIESRLERRLYANAAEMQTDLDCMYANALFYNDSESVYAVEAARQRDEVLATSVTYMPPCS